MKIILNKCFGIFQASELAHDMYAKKRHIDIYKYKMSASEYTLYHKVDKFGQSNSWTDQVYSMKDFGNIIGGGELWSKSTLHLTLGPEDREDPFFIEVVEELGKDASTEYSNLKVVEIPDDLNDFVIENYDGMEKLHQRVQEW